MRTRSLAPGPERAPASAQRPPRDATIPLRPGFRTTAAPPHPAVATVPADRTNRA